MKSPRPVPVDIEYDLQNLLKWRVPRTGQIEVEGELYSPQLIIEKVKPIMTEDRFEKLAAVVQQRSWSVATICDNLFDVGNISAVMRSSESFGFVEFKLLERPGANYKKSDRISKGSEKWLDTERTINTQALLQSQRSLGRKIIATTLKGGRSIEDVDLSEPLCLVFGNEKEGVSSEILASADEKVTLPMLGFTESFNISVAAALSYQRVHLARMKARGQNGDLTGIEQSLMLATYMLRSVGGPERVSAILRNLK